jgi:hypothetical protein
MRRKAGCATQSGKITGLHCLIIETGERFVCVSQTLNSVHDILPLSISKIRNVVTSSQNAACVLTGRVVPDGRVDLR